MVANLSFALDIDIGDKLSIMSPSGIQTIVGDPPKQETFIVVSVFESGLKDFDLNVAFINIIDLEGLFDLLKRIKRESKYILTIQKILFLQKSN